MASALPKLAAFAVLVIGVSPSADANAAPSIAQWRRDLSETRRLAEDDVPRAYEQARRLQESAPADATPGDRARALNLLARVEIYMAMPDESAEHARRASELAARH